jgi:hypothetical protein
MFRLRSESGMKMMSVRTIHSTSIRNKLSLSNFRCMKYAMFSAALTTENPNESQYTPTCRRSVSG